LIIIVSPRISIVPGDCVRHSRQYRIRKVLVADIFEEWHKGELARVNTCATLQQDRFDDGGTP
jgi:hypothetical protein